MLTFKCITLSICVHNCRAQLQSIKFFKWPTRSNKTDSLHSFFPVEQIFSRFAIEYIICIILGDTVRQTVDYQEILAEFQRFQSSMTQGQPGSLGLSHRYLIDQYVLPTQENITYDQVLVVSEHHGCVSCTIVLYICMAYLLKQSVLLWHSPPSIYLQQSIFIIVVNMFQEAGLSCSKT